MLSIEKTVLVSLPSVNDCACVILEHLCTPLKRIIKQSHVVDVVVIVDSYSLSIVPMIFL